MSQGKSTRRGVLDLSAFFLSLSLAFVLSILPVHAVQPDEILDDPKLEERARDLSAGLRCLVCQNQSIDDSDAPLARDLRLLVRERLEAGDSNDEVLDYVVGRYGEFVLLKPPFGMHTIALWVAPLIVLLLGIWMARRLVMGGMTAQREAASAAAAGEGGGAGSLRGLSEDEKRRLEELMKSGRD